MDPNELDPLLEGARVYLIRGVVNGLFATVGLVALVCLMMMVYR